MDYINNNYFKMKYFLTILALTISTLGYTQNNNAGRTGVYAGTGILTAQDLVTGISNMLTAGLIPDALKRIDVNGGPVFFGGIDYHPGEKTEIGIQINFVAYDQTFELRNGGTGMMKTSFFTPMAHGKYSWVKQKYFQFYSAASVGATFVTGKNTGGEKDRHTTIAFQLSPAGIRVGNTVAFFIESGFGFQGLLSGGISLQF